MKMNFWLLDIWYRVRGRNEKKPVVHLFGLTDRGERVLLLDDTTEPFFMTSAPIRKLKKLLPSEKRFERVTKNINAIPKEVTKVVTYLPSPDVRNFRHKLEKTSRYSGRSGKKYQTWEADIWFFIVYMKDKGVVPSSWHSVSVKEIKSIRHEQDYEKRIKYRTFKVLKIKLLKKQKMEPKLKKSMTQVMS